MTIPEIDLILTNGTLGGRFTTVEGILDQIYDELAEKAFVGDSSEVKERATYSDFLTGLKAVRYKATPLLCFHILTFISPGQKCGTTVHHHPRRPPREFVHSKPVRPRPRSQHDY